MSVFDNYAPTTGVQHRGQVRIAYRFAEENRDRFMYVRGLGWHVWDGKRWAMDEKDEATVAVLATLKTALADSFHDKELRADVAKCESAAGVRGVLDLASALPALRVAVADLDADPHLLNCANGTLDLRTRRLSVHRPADRITKVTTGAYDPWTTSADWTGFLATVLPDAEHRAYLQRVVGQAAYGRVREHLFPVLTGTGANGKGTAYGAITNALGDYATIVDPTLLMAGVHAGGPEMMTLLGARLVVGSETEESRKLDAATMKRLTGGDELTARRLYQEPVTWTPTHQLLYVTNYLPQVKGDDPAVWRRMRVVPFDVVIEAADRDVTLPETLQLAADAILTWVVDGWFDYEDRGGMDEPAGVKAATSKYQGDSDPVARFIAECCLPRPYAHVGARDLFHAWESWRIPEGVEQISEKVFGHHVERLGFARRKTNTGARWGDLALLSTEEE